MRQQINLLTAIDVFISFRFAEVGILIYCNHPACCSRSCDCAGQCCALTLTMLRLIRAQAHREALMIKAALEALGLVVFLSNVSPGGDLQDVISEALGMCKFAIILATKTYGAKTNGLFDTSNEMNYIISRSKPFYLVRMIPFDEEWAEMRTNVAFPPSIMQKVRTPHGQSFVCDLPSCSPPYTLYRVSYACCGTGSSGSRVMATRCRLTSCPRCATPSAYSV